MQARPLLFFSSLLLLAACTKTEQPASSSGATSASATTTAAPSASVVASAVPSASANPQTGVTAEPSASAVAVATASGSAAAAAPQCGTKPLPDCPLQAWMKANMNPAVSASDTKALAIALDKAATFAPAGYPNWSSIAKDGAAAAKKDDLQAAKAACKGCHDQYKDKFKKDVAQRSKKI